MSLNILEKVARQARNGSNVVRESSELFSKGFITPAEHKSLTSLSWQIAANVRANNDGTAYAKIAPTGAGWI